MSSSDHLQCPPSWFNKGTTCYKIHDGFKNVQDSQKYCHEQDAELISFRDVEEYDFLTSLFDNVTYTMREETKKLHMGAYDPYLSGVWRYMDGTMLWNVPQVDGLARTDGNPYTHISRNSGTVRNSGGTTERSFVCKSHAGKLN